MRKLGVKMMVVSLLVLSVGGCATDGDGTHEVAIQRALANQDLRHSADELSAQGWVVSDRAEASVDRFNPTADAIWTRVRVPMVGPSRAGQPGVAADLVVAWPDGGAEEFALAPHGPAAQAALAHDLQSVDRPDPQAVLALTGATTNASCGAENSACGGVTTCCSGLVCSERQDNHFSCFCSQPVEVRYNQQSTTSFACFSLFDNPVGAARYVRTIRGCGPNGGILADFCGRTIGVPSYTRSSSTALVCYDTPPRGCESE